VSASTAKGASLLLKELILNGDNHRVCYEGDFEDALANVHGSITISVNDVYGESVYPPLDTSVSGKNGESASAVISSCN
jgi:hypothetical protein